MSVKSSSHHSSSTAVESFVNSSEMLENQEYNKSKSDRGYHAVSPPYTGNFIPSKPDLMFMDEIVESDNVNVITIVTPSDVKKVESNHESVDKGDAVEPKTVRKNSFSPPIIEDWNSDDDSEVEFIRNVKTIRPSTEKIKFVKSARETVEKGNPHQKEYKEKGVIDSGCSRHMTGNKCYLTEYEDYDAGFVSFGDGKGRISGKGKIKTGTLDFDNVYFCKELKYNLFSVSQICDKKNNVLFTDTECLVLSSDFKLLDESQVLLRVPRKDNIYSVDLKSVVPTKGLTCIFAKAIIDESNLWHRRLGHINFKNMNKLVRGNLVRGLPLKIFENLALIGYEQLSTKLTFQKGKESHRTMKTILDPDYVRPKVLTFLREMDTGGSPKGQETMGVLLLRLDIVPPKPHDSPLTGGYTPGSDEGDLKLKKQRVKKLERKRSQASHTKKRYTGSDFDVLDDDMEDVEGETVHTATTGVSVVSAPVLTARSITTLQPLLTIDPKDKGKGVLVEEEPEKPEKVKRRDQGLAQIESDAELAQRLHEEELAELDRAQKERQKQEEATSAALAEEFDEIQARIDADHELANKARPNNEDQKSTQLKKEPDC
ncbi:putative ribonuclease H-like domain-containing protein [Tanacetum coccineum]